MVLVWWLADNRSSLASLLSFFSVDKLICWLADMWSGFYRPILILSMRAFGPGNSACAFGTSAIQHNWASKASPSTLGCSIEISRDIYVGNVCLS